MTVPNPDSAIATEVAKSNRLRISITIQKGALPHEYATSRAVSRCVAGAGWIRYADGMLVARFRDGHRRCREWSCSIRRQPTSALCSANRLLRRVRSSAREDECVPAAVPQPEESAH